MSLSAYVFTREVSLAWSLQSTDAFVGLKSQITELLIALVSSRPEVLVSGDIKPSVTMVSSLSKVLTLSLVAAACEHDLGEDLAFFRECSRPW